MNSIQIFANPENWNGVPEKRGTAQVKLGGETQLCLTGMKLGYRGLLITSYRINGRQYTLPRRARFTADEKGEATITVRIPNPKADNIQLVIMVWDKPDWRAYSHFEIEQIELI